MLGILAIAFVVSRAPCPPGLAQTNTPSTATTENFSRGFERFRTLGLPDVRGATYVLLKEYGKTASKVHLGHDLKLSGNAWMLKPQATTNASTDKLTASLRTFVLCDGSTLEVCCPEDISGVEFRAPPITSGAEGETSGPQVLNNPVTTTGISSDRKGTWREVDPRKDIDLILSLFAENKTNSAENANGNDPDADEDDDDVESILPYIPETTPIFFSAIFFHQNGYTNEAERIVRALFSVTDRHELIVSAVDDLGNVKYIEAFKRFRDKVDWKRYCQETAALTETFTSGWKALPAVKMLLSALRQRIASPEPPPVSGNDITAEDDALARELAEGTGSLDQADELWILRSESAAQDASAKTNDIIRKITDRGPRSIPMLLALLGDNYLTQIVHSGTDDGADPFEAANPFADTSDATEEDLVQAIYDSMDRPATRSEIAMNLLRTIRPGGEHDRDTADLDSEGFRDEMRQWYAELKTNSPIQLAMAYMKRGNEDQQRTAAWFVLRHGSSADITDVEQWMLDFAISGEHSYSSIPELYARKLGLRAKPFIDKYESLLRQSRDADSIESQLTTLRQIMDDRPLSELFSGLGPRENRDAQMAVRNRLSREPPDTAQGILLEQALRADDPNVAVQLLDMAGSLKTWCYDLDTVLDRSASTEVSSSNRTTVTHAELWKKLLADQRNIPAPCAQRERVQGLETIAQAAALAMEDFCSPEEDPFAFPGEVGERLFPVLTARARERLAGKKEADLTPLPSADNVSLKRRNDIIASLVRAAPDGIGDTFALLKPDEQLAIMEEARDNEALNKAASQRAHRITRVVDGLGKPPPFEECRSLTGQTLSRPLVEGMLELLKKLTAENRFFVCSFDRDHCLRGVTVTLEETAPEPQTDPKRRGASATNETSNAASVSGWIQAADGAYYDSDAWWPVAVNAPASTQTSVVSTTTQVDDDELDATEDETSDKQSLDRNGDFWEALGDWLSGSNNVFVALSMELTGCALSSQAPDDDDLPVDSFEGPD